VRRAHPRQIGHDLFQIAPILVQNGPVLFQVMPDLLLDVPILLCIGHDLFQIGAILFQIMPDLRQITPDLFQNSAQRLPIGPQKPHSRPPKADSDDVRVSRDL
jgi:hypothetical protein